MIKINLSNVQKQLDLSNIGGFDFSKIKIKAVIIFTFLIYIPDFFLIPSWEEKRETLQTEVNTKQVKNSSLKKKIAKSREFERQIKELKTQEEILGQKLVAVKKAINEKKNPWDLLYFFAKNVPNDLWIEKLDLNEAELKISGESLNYQSIGDLVNVMRSSVFIKDAKILSTSSKVRASDKRRIESFEVVFSIARFEP